jgi:hypothetical protein
MKYVVEVIFGTEDRARLFCAEIKDLGYGFMKIVERED